MASCAIVLFRNDLRLSDNAALAAAASSGLPVMCVFVLDPDAPDPDGGARRWWRHHSLTALSNALALRGGQLVLRRGDTQSVLDQLITDTRATHLYWNRRYTPDEVAADTALKSHLTERGVIVSSCAGRYLTEPWQVMTKSATPFRVFTPYWRASKAMLQAGGAVRPCPMPTEIAFAPNTASDTLKDWNLLPTSPNWAAGFDPVWQPGEEGAHQQLGVFLESHAKGYAEGRDVPAAGHVSRLSPHLQMGEITPRQIWAAADRALHLGQMSERDAEKFRAEIGWRDFSAQLLFHNPDLQTAEFQPKFRSFPWRDDATALAAWQAGQTGYPIVDAGLRELWQTGYMHNRVRMIAASFLVKHLRINWRHGRDWFYDTLVDADLASNTASWQWVAGCGADAAPYFRIFNPITQATKFDPEGTYIRRWVPELSALPDRHLAAPWLAPEQVLQAAEVDLGETYPRPIVDHAAAREAALTAFGALPQTSHDR